MFGSRLFLEHVRIVGPEVLNIQIVVVDKRQIGREQIQICIGVLRIEFGSVAALAGRIASHTVDVGVVAVALTVFAAEAVEREQTRRRGVIALGADQDKLRAGKAVEQLPLARVVQAVRADEDAQHVAGGEVGAI